MPRFYDDEGMNFAVLISLGFAYANIADVGGDARDHRANPER